MVVDVALLLSVFYHVCSYVLYYIVVRVCIFVCILNFALDSCFFHFLRLPLCWLCFIYCHVCGDVCCSEYCMVKCTLLNKDKQKYFYNCKIFWVWFPCWQVELYFSLVIPRILGKCIDLSLQYGLLCCFYQLFGL